MKHILDLDRNLVVSRPENHYHDVLILKNLNLWETSITVVDCH